MSQVTIGSTEGVDLHMLIRAIQVGYAAQGVRVTVTIGQGLEAGYIFVEEHRE